MLVNNKVYSFVAFQELSIVELQEILDWRNHESIRKWMYNQDLVSLDDHLKFAKQLNNTNEKLYFLVKRDNLPIGVFSLVNIRNNFGEWGYYLAPRYHNKSLGVEFYYAVLSYCFSYLNFDKIVGYAMESNRAANSLNTLFSFDKRTVSKIGFSELYYERFLTKEIWFNEVCVNKKIQKLLEITK